MHPSFKKTVEDNRREVIRKRNSPIIEKIRKMDKYIASINILSPIVSSVVDKRQARIMKQRYSRMMNNNVSYNVNL